MEIVGSVWFTEMGSMKTIGIVVCYATGFEEKAYIGTGEGLSQEIDEQHIASHGAKFPLELARQMI